VPPADPPDETAVTQVLRRGEITVTGRLTDASNITLLGTVTVDGSSVECVYKPVRGERPLWDFPDGTLAGREVASYLISRAAGWHCVPVTVLRDGPYGPGMVQQWITDADSDLTADLLPADELPDGWLPVLSAVDMEGNPVVVAHADTPALAVLAGFDLVVNNADRKASHILPTPDGRVRGVDHGVTLLEQDKLRTILWGWAGQALPESVTDGLERLVPAVAGTLGERLSGLIGEAEIAALAARVRALLSAPRFPEPPRHRTPIPWPPLCGRPERPRAVATMSQAPAAACRANNRTL
jgi:uncharacterized repeat protein (TIGR03843 family)